MDPFLGMIFVSPYNFAPQGFALCDGSLLNVSQNAALFSLLGTTFGGNGQSTFALPDLRGRVIVGAGQGPGLSNYMLGQRGGVEAVSLNAAQLPAHTHALNVSSKLANTSAPGNDVLAATSVGKDYSNVAPDKTMAAASIGTTGTGTPVSIVQPYLAIYYLIATQGIYPSRP